MFSDVVLFQHQFDQLKLMPLTSVTDCKDAAGAATAGSAKSKWPGGDFCSQSRRNEE